MSEKLSDRFKLIYNNKEEVNKRIKVMLEQWEEEDYEKINKKTKQI